MQETCESHQNSKLLILGLDGLELKLVLRWNLTELLQKFYGKFHVGDLNRLYTPLIWSSILCGFNVEEKGYDYEKAVRKSMGKLGLLHILKKSVIGEEKRMWLMRKMLRKLGLLNPPKFVMPKELLKETFLDEVEKRGFKVFVLEVPGYNEKTNGIFRLEMPKLVTSGTLKTKRNFLKGVMQEAEKRLTNTKKAIRNHDLVMCYLPLPDLAHHLFFKGFKSKVEILTLYKWLETKTKNLLEDAYKLNFKVLIISDHGFDMVNYDHTNYGFWSTNFKTEMKDYTNIKNCIFGLYPGTQKIKKD